MVGSKSKLRRSLLGDKQSKAKMKRSPLKTDPDKVRAWQQRSSQPLAVNHPIRKVGRLGNINKAARQKIAEIAQEENMRECELKLEGCTRNWPLAPAHRHKRAWYAGDADKLSDRKQWICACQTCHDQIEIDSNLTEEIFIKLRGPEEEDMQIIPEI